MGFHSPGPDGLMHRPGLVMGKHGTRRKDQMKYLANDRCSDRSATRNRVSAPPPLAIGYPAFARLRHVPSALSHFLSSLRYRLSAIGCSLSSVQSSKFKVQSSKFVFASI